MTTSGTRTPALRGHHRRERLVLDLLDAADGHAPPRVAVGERAPTPCEPLGVLRVSPEHPYRRPAFRSRRGRRTPPSRPAGARPGRDRSSGRRAPRARRGSARSAGRRPPSRTPAARARRRPGRTPARRGQPKAALHRARRRRSPPGRRALRRACRIGRTSSGPATTRIAVIPATRSSGKPHRESRWPSIGTQSDTIAPPSTTPSPTSTASATAMSRARSQRRSHEDVDHDEERKRDRGDEQPAPHRIRPAEHRDDPARDLLVLPRRRRSDDSCKPDDDRPERQKHAVDRPPVPPPRLGDRQERRVPERLNVIERLRGRHTASRALQAPRARCAPTVRAYKPTPDGNRLPRDLRCSSSWWRQRPGFRPLATFDPSEDGQPPVALGSTSPCLTRVQTRSAGTLIFTYGSVFGPCR